MYFLFASESLQTLSWDICLPLQLFLRYIFCKYFNSIFTFYDKTTEYLCLMPRKKKCKSLIDLYFHGFFVELFSIFVCQNKWMFISFVKSLQYKDFTIPLDHKSIGISLFYFQWPEMSNRYHFNWFTVSVLISKTTFFRLGFLFLSVFL